MNHADHVYWTGTSISHVVASVRASGQQLAIERRGIEASRSAILPIPLEAESRTLSPTSAKERLGLASDAFVLLTMAAAYKYTPIAGAGFLDIVEPWLLGHPRAVLIAVGPVPRGSWSQAAMRTGGRVRALGTRTDVALYFESADVYLDSYPLGSLTSALQAGMWAIPLLTYACRPPEARILGADSPGLDRVMLQATTLDAYADSLTALYDDPVLREHLGNETAASITRWHTGQGWRDACDRVYDLASTIGTSPPSPVTVSHGYTTLDDLLCEMGGGNGIVDVLTRQLPFMTLGARLSTWYALTKRNAHPGARQVLPEAILQVLRLFRSMRVGRRG
jgi:hypothetical protein